MKKFTFLTFISIIALFSAACYISTANLTDVRMCDSLEVGESQCPSSDQAVFQNDVPQIFVTAVLNNAPEGTELTFTWRYLEDDYDIDVVSITSEDLTSDVYSYLTIPDNGWPTGKYEVVLDLGTDNSEPIHKKFEVEGPEIEEVEEAESEADEAETEAETTTETE